MKRYMNQETERTLLANERTFLAYVRTAFAVAIFGFAFVEFSQRPFSQSIGIVFSVSGLGLLIAGFIIFLMRRRMILKKKI